MAAWMIWLIIGVLLVIAEMMTLTFYLLWLGIGALAAVIVAWLFPDTLWLQVIVASFVAVGLTFFTRPLTKKVQGAKGYEDAIDYLVGKHGEVVEPIHKGTIGIVRVGNETWSATAEEHLEIGQAVVVLDRGSTVLKVSRWGGE